MVPEPITPPNAGTTAKVKWADGRYYNVKVVAVNVDGTCKVRWLDDDLVATKLVTKRLSIRRLEDIVDDAVEEERGDFVSIFNDGGDGDEDY